MVRRRAVGGVAFWCRRLLLLSMSASFETRNLGGVSWVLLFGGPRGAIFARNLALAIYLPFIFGHLVGVPWGYMGA